MTNVTVGAGMVTKSIEGNAQAAQFSEFEIELNQLVRKHFPHWQAVDLAQLMKK